MLTLEEPVGFLDHEGRVQLLDRAEEGWGTDVGGDQRPVDQLREKGQEGSFAAAPGGGLDADVGANIAQFEGEGVQDPKSEGFRSPFGQDNKADEKLQQRIEQESAVHGLWPGNNRTEEVHAGRSSEGRGLAARAGPLRRRAFGGQAGRGGEGIGGLMDWWMSGLVSDTSPLVPLPLRRQAFGRRAGRGGEGRMRRGGKWRRASGGKLDEGFGGPEPEFEGAIDGRLGSGQTHAREQARDFSVEAVHIFGGDKELQEG